MGVASQTEPTETGSKKARVLVDSFILVFYFIFPA